MTLDIKKYLHRINFEEDPRIDLSSLKNLHTHQLYNIPFENFDILNKKKFFLNINFLENKILDNQRGGFCYELNGLFYELLKQIGFDAKMISARVYNQEGILGPEYDHMAIVVQLDKPYLVDVGFGAAFLEPLLLQTGTIQKDFSGYFKIEKYDSDYLCLFISDDGVNFKRKYLFTTKMKKTDDFLPMFNYHQSDTRSVFAKKIICTKATPNGRITIANKKLIVTINKKKIEHLILSDQEMKGLLKEMFGLSNVYEHYYF